MCPWCFEDFQPLGIAAHRAACRRKRQKLKRFRCGACGARKVAKRQPVRCRQCRTKAMVPA